jgi:hypothetical protein
MHVRILNWNKMAAFKSVFKDSRGDNNNTNTDRVLSTLGQTPCSIVILSINIMLQQGEFLREIFTPVLYMKKLKHREVK